MEGLKRLEYFYKKIPSCFVLFHFIGVGELEWVFG